MMTRMTYEKSHFLKVLLILGKEGAIDRERAIKTSLLAEKLKVSQQTVSRWLEELNSEGLIHKKQQIGQGLIVKITKKGLEQLQQVYSDLQFIFQEIPKQIRGQVSTGLGEGGYYISLPGYMEQFKKVLGWTPFSGTMNLKLITEEDRDAFEKLSKSQYKLIHGFFHEETKRNLGKVFLYRCRVKYTSETIDGAVIIPDRTHHSPEIMEILAKENLRKLWDLHDGDTLIIQPIPFN